MKHIDSAMERLKTKNSLNEKDLSLIERVLASESDPKTAYILALDLILVGIDTVSSSKSFVNKLKKNTLKACGSVWC